MGNILSKEDFIEFLKEAQNQILAMLARVDGGCVAQRRSWDRPGGGGGTMGVIRGEVVEKGACNVSVVYGTKNQGAQTFVSPAHQQTAAGEQPFFACGLSSIVHMACPHAPTAHLNVRYFQVGDEAWFGGGADLTPHIEYPEDTEAFHNALREVCLRYHPKGEVAYDEYKTWCDEYYTIKHRQKPRGVGGIFFDRLKGSFAEVSPFMVHLTRSYGEVMESILQKRALLPYSEAEKESQLYWRGQYVEFNLLYDVGTRFGLESGGDLEAIFVSLPPVVRW